MRDAHWSGYEETCKSESKFIEVIVIWAKKGRIQCRLWYMEHIQVRYDPGILGGSKLACCTVSTLAFRGVTWIDEKHEMTKPWYRLVSSPCGTRDGPVSSFHICQLASSGDILFMMLCAGQKPCPIIVEWDYLQLLGGMHIRDTERRKSAKIILFPRHPVLFYPGFARNMLISSLMIIYIITSLRTLYQTLYTRSQVKVKKKIPKWQLFDPSSLCNWPIPDIAVKSCVV